MAKIRGIKTETWTDDKFVQLSPLARLLFIGMWNYACDNGHVEDNAVQLKIRLLPIDNCDVSELIDEMVATGQVERHPGYLKIPKLPEHQRIDLYWLTFCEHCGDDPDCAFQPSDKKSSKRGASAATDGKQAGSRRAPDGDKSGASRAQDYERRGDEVRGDELIGGETTTAPRKRATQLPKDFRPGDKHIALAADLGVDLRREWPKFTDHHRAKGSTFKDWSAALNNWIRKAAEYGGATVHQFRPAVGDDGQPVLPPLPMDDKR